MTASDQATAPPPAAAGDDAVEQTMGRIYGALLLHGPMQPYTLAERLGMDMEVTVQRCLELLRNRGLVTKTNGEGFYRALMAHGSTGASASFGREPTDHARAGLVSVYVMVLASHGEGTDDASILLERRNERLALPTRLLSSGKSIAGTVNWLFAECGLRYSEHGIVGVYEESAPVTGTAVVIVYDV
jgi:hypothetical protein